MSAINDKTLRDLISVGADANRIAAHFLATAAELDAFCQAQYGHPLALVIEHERSRASLQLEVDVRAMARAAKPGTNLPAAPGLIGHALRQSQPRGRKSRPAPVVLGDLDETLLRPDLVRSAEPTTGYDRARCCPEYLLVINKSENPQTPYANMVLRFASRDAREAGKRQLLDAMTP